MKFTKLAWLEIWHNLGQKWKKKKKKKPSTDKHFKSLCTYKINSKFNETKELFSELKKFQTTKKNWR